MTINRVSLGVASALLLSFAATASAETITSLTNPGSWANNSSNGGNGQIIDVTGLGGNLETNAPAGTGVLELSTDATGTPPNGLGTSKAEVKIQGNFGTIGDFVNSGSMGYDYYQTSGGPSSTIAPALKFEVLDVTNTSGDGYATFIYEPYYNGGVGAYDTWHNVGITGDSGNFWHTTLYNVSGIDFDETILDWATLLGSMQDAVITSIIFGIGSGTPNELGYVDNFYFYNGNTSFTADFEVSAVPLPAALPLYGAGLAAMGLIGWARKRKTVKTAL